MNTCFSFYLYLLFHMVKKQQIHLNIYLLSKITEHRRLGRHNLLFNRYFGNLVVCSLIFYYGQRQQCYRNIILLDKLITRRYWVDIFLFFKKYSDEYVFLILFTGIIYFFILFHMCDLFYMVKKKKIHQNIFLAQHNNGTQATGKTWFAFQ